MLMLKEIRQKRNLTQEELAGHLGLTRNAIYLYEAHQREPNLKILKQMSIILQCSLDELVA